MLVQRYLAVGKRSGYAPSARLTKTAPRLEPHEIAIKILLDVPVALFTKPALTAAISIPEESVSSHTINAATISDLEEVVSRELGLDLTISLPTIENAGQTDGD